MCRRLARLYSESARCLETRQQYRKDLKRLCSWIYFFLLSFKRWSFSGGAVGGRGLYKVCSVMYTLLLSFRKSPWDTCSLFYLFVLLSLHVN